MKIYNNKFFDNKINFACQFKFRPSPYKLPIEGMWYFILDINEERTKRLAVAYLMEFLTRL